MDKHTKMNVAPVIIAGNVFIELKLQLIDHRQFWVRVPFPPYNQKAPIIFSHLFYNFIFVALKYWLSHFFLILATFHISPTVICHIYTCLFSFQENVINFVRKITKKGCAAHCATS